MRFEYMAVMYVSYSVRQIGIYRTDKLKFSRVCEIEFSIIHEFLMVAHQDQKRMSFSFL